jgi:copper resistance protein B
MKAGSRKQRWRFSAWVSGAVNALDGRGLLFAAVALAATTSCGRAQVAGMGDAGKMPAPAMDNRTFTHVLFDEFEGRSNGEQTEFRWNGEGWTGTDWTRLWVKSEGFAGQSSVSDGDHELLYDRPIPRMRYFDVQAGVRADLDSEPSRVWAAIGMEGLAPWRFQFAPTFYIRNDGHVAGRMEAEYDIALSQRLIVQPQAELNFYSKDDPARKTGSGFSDLDAGIRLRYALRRKFSPYIGYAYDGKYDGSAGYARAAGERTATPTLVFGVRIWR